MTWIQTATNEELIRLLEDFAFESEHQLDKATELGKIMDKALETWDNKEDFGLHAAKVFLVLSKNEELRKRMGFN